MRVTNLSIDQKKTDQSAYISFENFQRKEEQAMGTRLETLAQ